MSDPDLMVRRKRLLGPGFPLFYDEPVHVVRGEGVWLFDAEGRRYLDAYNNVAHVGHCHPHVLAALTRQAGILNTHTRYLHEIILDYAERLCETFDDPLSAARFACTGTEANELALRIARAVTGGTGVIVTQHCYHGNSAAIAELSAKYAGASGLPDHVCTIPAPDAYRPLDDLEGQALADAYVDRVAQAIESMHARGIRLAALMVDSIFSGEGLPDVPRGFLAKAVALARAAGGLFIADEVQPGFGRTGDHMWGYASHRVVPDIATMGKPMGNGHPLAGLVASGELLREFGEAVSYFNTFGGNPVSCAVGIAVLEVLEGEGLVENARTVGDYARRGLESLATKHDLIGDVRGSGLFLGAELVQDRTSKEPAVEETRRIVNGMRERGVLIGDTGMYDNVLKIRPPMPFSRDEADLLLSTLDDVLSAI